MRGGSQTVKGAGSSALKAWFNTIASHLSLVELHLFTKDMKYVLTTHSKEKRREVAESLPLDKSAIHVVDTEFAALIADRLEKVLGGETVTFEAEHGGRRYLSHAVPMQNQSDGETYILFHSTDVTELANFEHKSNPRARSGADVRGESGPKRQSIIRGDDFLELAPVSMFFVDNGGEVIGATREFCETMGFGRNDIIGKTIYEFVPGILPKSWSRTLAAVRKNGKLKRNVELRQSGGALVLSEVEFTAAIGRSGDLICATIKLLPNEGLSGEDIAQSEEKFRLISENVPDLIAVLDLKGRHVYVNPAYKSIISNPESLLGKEVLEIVHPDDRQKVEVVLREGMVTGLEQRIEFRMLAPDGSVKFVEARGKAVHDSKGRLRNAVIVSRDVTERNKMEEQYFRNQRIESLGTLAGGISHDLNNVLTPVILGVEALKRVRMDDRGLAILNSISTSLRRGRDIVRQVLTFARGVEGGTMLIQFRHILKEAVALMKETFPKSIAIVSNIPKSLWLINGDATRVDQLIMNLCVNSRDAMQEGGIIYISADNVMIDEQFAVMEPEAKPGPYVQLTIQDTGLGMSSDVKEHVFEPFYTTKETGKGTGLGLSIVHTIVKSHGGFIMVETEQGKGTTFQVYFPAVEVSEEDRHDEDQEKPVAGNGELLLVVDDEVSVCQITKQTLEAFGYRVLTATDGTEAVAVFAEHRQNIALVVMDIAMPIMDGPRTIRALKKLKPDIRIIASSGIVPEDHLNLEPASAPNAFLQKPYTSDRLLQTINTVLRAN